MGNYIQPLWQQVGPTEASSEIYNGAVEAAATLLGAGLALLLGWTKVVLTHTTAALSNTHTAQLNWSVLGEPVLAVISLLDAAVLLLMASASSLATAYIG